MPFGYVARKSRPIWSLGNCVSMGGGEKQRMDESLHELCSCKNICFLSATKSIWSFSVGSWGRALKEKRQRKKQTETATGEGIGVFQYGCGPRLCPLASWWNAGFQLLCSTPTLLTVFMYRSTTDLVITTSLSNFGSKSRLSGFSILEALVSTQDSDIWHKESASESYRNAELIPWKQPVIQARSSPQYSKMIFFKGIGERQMKDNKPGNKLMCPVSEQTE